MIDLILAFLFGWIWGSREENKQVEEKDVPLNIQVDGQDFGYLKNKDEDLR